MTVFSPLCCATSNKLLHTYTCDGNMARGDGIIAQHEWLPYEFLGVAAAVSGRVVVRGSWAQDSWFGASSCIEISSLTQ